MIELTGIGNLNELQVARPLKGNRNLEASDSKASTKDQAVFSAEGQGASEVAKFVRESAKSEELRQERVDAAKQNVEQGRHKVEEVVNVVAAALIGYL